MNSVVLSAFFAIAVVAVTSVCHAESPENPDKPPTSIVARFQPGAWIHEEKDACPILAHRKESRLAVFSRDSSDAVMKLANRMDSLVTGNERLKSSFLFVSHENRPTPSEDEWSEQFATLKKQTAKFEITHLAAGLMIRLPDEKAVTRARRQVGVFQDGDVVVMLIVPQQNTYGIVRELVSLKSSELTDEKLDAVEQKMKAAAGSLSE